MNETRRPGPLATGLGRLLAAPRVVVAVWLASVLLALPLAAAMGEILSAAIGPSVSGERMLHGFDHLWFHGFSATRDGLANTFDPSISGIGAVARSLDTLVTGALLGLHPAVFAVGVVYVLLWVFVTGGLLARFVGDDRAGGALIARAARHFPRMLALTSTAFLLQAFIFRLVLGGLSDAVDTLTYDVVDERIHFVYVVAKYTVVWGLVWTVSLLFDYAKIAAVRRPAAPLTSCLLEARRFLGGRAASAYGLSATLFVLLVAAVLAYSVIAPGAGQHNGFSILIAFAISQLYIVARIALRVWGVGAQAALFAPPRTEGALPETPSAPVG